MPSHPPVRWPRWVARIQVHHKSQGSGHVRFMSLLAVLFLLLHYQNKLPILVPVQVGRMMPKGVYTRRWKQIRTLTAINPPSLKMLTLNSLILFTSDLHLLCPSPNSPKPLQQTPGRSPRSPLRPSSIFLPLCSRLIFKSHM